MHVIMVIMYNLWSNYDKIQGLNGGKKCRVSNVSLSRYLARISVMIDKIVKAASAGDCAQACKKTCLSLLLPIT